MQIRGRTPKRGFKNPGRIEFKVFNLGQIEQLADKYEITEFTMETLYVNGLVSRTDKVKVLGNGELKKKLNFKVNAVSDKAKAAIETAGGSIELISYK